MRGAEAVLSRKSLLGMEAVVKSRVPKTYRIAELDRRLRSERTRSEARLLHKAKLAGVPCPTVLEVGDFDITMTHVRGKRPGMAPKAAREAGRLLGLLHAAGIIHGDFTPANLIEGGRLWVIDFGLGFVSDDVEDKAVDVFTMLRSLDSQKKKEAFTDGYNGYRNSKSVLGRVKDVEKRVRYAF